MDYGDTSTPSSDEEALRRIGDEETLAAKYEGLREHLSINAAWECTSRTFTLLPEELALLSSWLLTLKEAAIAFTSPCEATLVEKLRAFYVQRHDDIDHYALIAIRKSGHQ